MKLKAENYGNIFKTFKPEDWVQYQWCKWMDETYPSIIYHTNILQGVRLHPVVSARAKLLGSKRHMPDVMVFHPTADYHGLFLELKREGEKVFTNKGGIRSDKKDQFDMLCSLGLRGYAAFFACGIEEAKTLTQNYINQTLYG